MKLTFEIPTAARTALSASRKWTGMVTMDIQPERGDRDTIRLTIMQEEAQSSKSLSPNERAVVQAWNNDPYISGQAKNESRNNLTTDAEVETHINVIRKAIADIGKDKLLANMRGYFDSCQDGRHLRLIPGSNRTSNHGYKNLIGFLRKLLELKRTGKGRPWWMQKSHEIGDDNPDLTIKMADMFASILLQRNKYGLTMASPAYVHFRTAAAYAKITSEKNPWGLKVERIMKEVVRCAADGVKDGMVSPGHLVTEHLWKVRMPQWLRQRFE